MSKVSIYRMARAIKAAFDAAKKHGSISNAVCDMRSKTLEGLLDRPGVFNAISLLAWLKIVEKADVPFIPAVIKTQMPIDMLIRHDEHHPGDEVYAKKFFDDTADVKQGHMLRWDCCASERLKVLMHEGAGYSDDLVKLTPADMRLFDILVNYPGDEVAVVERPWVLARSEGGRPVEYRVFIENNNITGISNYYVQRPIELNMPEVVDCITKADKILKACIEQNSVPWALHYDKLFNHGQVSCTIDFLIERDTDKAIFIEAGPAFGAGAHPCCFEHNVINDKIACFGVALNKEAKPILPGLLEHVQKALNDQW